MEKPNKPSTASASKEAPPAGPGFYNIGPPTLDGFAVQVQRGGAEGVDEAGSLGLGLIVGPDGLPRIMLQMKHADGESLTAIMGGDDLGLFSTILVDVTRQAAKVEIAARAMAAAGGKPS